MVFICANVDHVDHEPTIACSLLSRISDWNIVDLYKSLPCSASAAVGDPRNGLGSKTPSENAIFVKLCLSSC